VTKGQLKVRAYHASDVGRVRDQNEDSLFSGATTFAVADGMGGHQAGEVASDTALEPIRRLDGRRFPSAKELQQALTAAISTANTTVADKAAAEPGLRGMGTTLTAAVVRDGQLYVAHVGDSRAYLLRTGEEITQLTTDHTLVEQLVREGRISRQEAAAHPQRSVITRAVGVEDEVEVDSLPPLVLQPGDQVLLCSDGLTGLVDDEQITDILGSAEDGDAACAGLIDAANAAGGLDNITVVLLRVTGEGAAPAPVDSDDEEPADRAAQDVRQIRTREETGKPWAEGMRRWGAPQGVPRRPRGGGGGRLRAVLATVLAIVVLLGVIGAGGWLLINRAYFVGTHDGNVTIFRGIPQSPMGFDLYQVEEKTDLEADLLPPNRQRRLDEGITVGSLPEGRRLVAEYRRQLEEAEDAEASEDPPADGEEGEPTP
jgi:PPM family protein phosphatase